MPATLDGKIVCMDGEGKPMFYDLLYHRRSPLFIAFDILSRGHEDLRHLPLVDRKQELRRVLAKSKSSSVLYADHVDGKDIALFERVCELDNEGIVAKHRWGNYTSDAESRTWFKIRNRDYSQWDATRRSSGIDIGSRLLDGMRASWRWPPQRRKLPRARTRGRYGNNHGRHRHSRVSASLTRDLSAAQLQSRLAKMEERIRSPSRTERRASSSSSSSKPTSQLTTIESALSKSDFRDRMRRCGDKDLWTVAVGASR